MKKSASAWLRYICNIWTIISLGIVVADFLRLNSLEPILGPTLAIYIGVLVVYSAEKEFERWTEYYEGRHPGELYIIAWTVLIAILLAAALFVERDYHLPEEVVATYIGVISIMAFTNKSKAFFNRRRK